MAALSASSASFVQSRVAAPAQARVSAKRPGRVTVHASLAEPEGHIKMEPHEALDFSQTLPVRSRRNRKNAALRQMFCETEVTPANFILPLYVHESLHLQ